MTTEAHTAFGERAAGTGNRSVGDLLDEVAAWQQHRENLAEQEDHGRARPDDWAASDDQAVDLLRELADAVTVHLATAVPDPAARTAPRPVDVITDADNDEIVQLRQQLDRARANLSDVTQRANQLRDRLDRYDTPDKMGTDQQADIQTGSKDK